MSAEVSRRGWFAYAMFVVASLSLVGILLWPFIWRPSVDWLTASYLLSSLLLSFGVLNVAFRRQWHEALRRAALLGIVLFPYYGSGGATLWLHVKTFRHHISPVEKYLSRCRLIEFVENGTPQRLGRCETFDLGQENYLEVYYDSSGEMMLPPGQRTAEWREAMAHFSPHAVLLDKADRAGRLIDGFYELKITSDELDGDDEK